MRTVSTNDLDLICLVSGADEMEISKISAADTFCIEGDRGGSDQRGVKPSRQPRRGGVAPPSAPIYSSSPPSLNSCSCIASARRTALRIDRTLDPSSGLGWLWNLK